MNHIWHIAQQYTYSKLSIKIQFDSIPITFFIVSAILIKRNGLERKETHKEEYQNTNDYWKTMNNRIYNRRKLAEYSLTERNVGHYCLSFFLVIIRLNLTKLSKYFEIRIFTVIQFGQSDTAFHLWQHSCESNLNEIEKKNQKKKKFLGGKKIQNEILKGMTDNRIPEIGEWWLRCLKLFNALSQWLIHVDATEIYRFGLYNRSETGF